MIFSEHSTAGEGSTAITENPINNNYGRQSWQNRYPPVNVGASSHQPATGRENNPVLVTNVLPQMKENNAVVDQDVMGNLNDHDTVIGPNNLNKETSILVLDTKRRRTELIDANGPGLENIQNNNTDEKIQDMTNMENCDEVNVDFNG
ncbi:hypothetical protein CsatB_025294 [Cannabis sativa]